MNENDGNMEYIQLKQLPKSTLNDAGRQFLNYSTAIFALSTQNSADDAKLIGSGTFVTVNQRNYVLTASHVIKSRPFERAEGIGFALKTGRHHFSLNREHLTDIHFGAATDPQSGPDLALISIPEAHVGTISTYNSFWNINGNSTTALNEPIELIHSAWVLAAC